MIVPLPFLIKPRLIKVWQTSRVLEDLQRHAFLRPTSRDDLLFRNGEDRLVKDEYLEND